MAALADVFLRVRPDTTGMSAELKRDVESAASRVSARVNVAATVKMDRSIFTGEMAKLKVELARTGDWRVRVKIDNTEAAFKKMEADAAASGNRAGQQTGNNMVKAAIAAAVVGSPIIGAALVGGLGLSVIGVGIAASIQNVSVKNSITALGTSIKAEMAVAALPFQQAIKDSAGIAANAFKAIGPSLNQVFTTLAPSLTELTQGLAGFMQKAMPGMEAGAKAAAAVLSSLAAELPGLGSSISSFFESLNAQSDGLKTGLVVAIHLVEAAVSILSNVISNASAVMGFFGSGILGNVTVLQTLIEVVGSAYVAYKAYGVAVTTVAAAQKAWAAATAFLSVAQRENAAAITAGQAVTNASAVTSARAAVAVETQTVAMAQADVAAAVLADTQLATAASAMDLVAANELAIEAEAGLTVAMGEAAAAEAVEGASLAVATGGLSLIIPLVLAAAAAIGIFALTSSGSASDTKDLSKELLGLGNAYNTTHTMSSQAVQDAIKNSAVLSDLVANSDKYGVSIANVAKATAGEKQAQQDVINALVAKKDALNAASAEAWTHNVGGITALAAQQTQVANDAQIAGIDKLLPKLRDEFQQKQQLDQITAELVKADLLFGDAQQQAAARATILTAGVQQLTTTFANLRAPALATAQVMQTMFDNLNQPAIDAMNAAMTATSATLTMNKQFADSSRALKDAQSSQASTAIEGSKSNAQASRTVTDAQLSEVNAQKALTQARKDATQQLKDLHTQVAGLADSEEEARIRLAEAQIQANQTVQLPTTDLTRRRAVVGLDEAKQNLQAVLDANQQIRDKTAAADKAGVNGAPTVIAAQKTLKDAHQSTTDAIANQKSTAISTAKANSDAARNTQAAADANSKSLDISTLAGIKNTQTIEGQLSASHDQYIADLKASDGSEASTTKIHDSYLKRNDSIKKNDDALGFNKGKVQDLINKWDDAANFPDSQHLINTLMSVTGVDQASAAVDGFFSKIDTWLAAHGVILTPVAAPANGAPNLPGGSTYHSQVPKFKAQGGLLQGPGTGTSDSIPVMASKGEYIVRAAAVEKAGLNFMDWVNNLDKSGGKLISGDPDAVKVKFATGGYVNTSTLSGINKASAGNSANSVAGVQDWLKTFVAGKPYVFGSVGPNTFDCSGLVGEVWARLTGHPSNHRYFSTSDEAGYFKAGKGEFTVGLSSTHTVGNLGGLGFEAAHTGAPIRVGSSAQSVDKFPQVLYLPQVAGQFVSSGTGPAFSGTGGGATSTAPVKFTNAQLNQWAVPITPLTGIMGALHPQILKPIVASILKTGVTPPGGSGASIVGGGALTAQGANPDVVKIAAATAHAVGADQKAALALFETGIVESGFKNEANSNVPASLLIPHQGVGNDHTSVGFLQQQVGNSGTGAGWGTVAEAMNVDHATRAFLTKAMSRESKFPTAGQLAQSVQVSAYPLKYDQAEGAARRLLAANGYDEGGWLQPGPVNNTGKPEAVLTPAESAGLKAMVGGGNQEIRLDEFTIQRIVQALSTRPNKNYIDGQELTDAVSKALGRRVGTAGM